MGELQRRDLIDAGADPDRDGRIESLLVQGLDCYFAGRHEEAVHIWTRVLFLDRTHPRARAYIDRARTALAERLRQSDELLHASQALLEQGRTGDARELLSAAIAASGDDERAAALRMRLDRAERAQWGVSTPLSPVSLPSTPNRFAHILEGPAVWWSLVGATGLVMVWLVGRLLVPAMRPADPATSPALVPAQAVAILGGSDVALVRARTLYARGRLAEALRELDRVMVDSELRPEADRLRVDIQRLLLAADIEHASAPGRLH